MTGIAMLIMAMYIVNLIKRARKKADKFKQEDDQAGKEPTQEAGAEERKADKDVKDPYLRSSFVQGFERLKSQSRSRDFRYKVPWFVLLGQTGSRPTDMLANSGMTMPLGKPEERDFASELGCRWWFFDRGVVIDLAGEYVLRADGESSDERGFRSFMRLLQRFRPRRPIDGVVLTISAKDLLEAAKAGALGTSTIEQKASLVYNALWQFQKTLGIKFPVYIQITDSDKIRGFGPFTDVLPDNLRQGMFGWSTPYSVDTTYRPDWVDEAFDGMADNLDRIQLEIFAEVPEIKEPDEVFIFPSELQRIKEPLRIYLNQLFKPIAYHESMLLRGIYFTGAEQPELPPVVEQTDNLELPPIEMPDSPSLEAPRANFFLKELFEKKVFRESGLATPTGASLAHKNRRVRLAQVGLAVLTVVLGLSLWIGYGNLRSREDVLRGFLDETQEELERFEDTIDWQGGSERRQLQKGATDFLAGLTQLDASRFFSLGIARSWIPDFNNKLEDAFVRAYDVIVFQAIRQELENRAAIAASSRLIDIEYRDNRFDAPANEYLLPTPVEEMPEFRALVSYVETLIELEEMGDLYNDLQRTQSLEDLSTTVEFLFDEPLPEGFFRNASLYEAALERVDYEEFQVDPFRLEAIRRTRELYDAFYRALFDENPFALTLESLTQELASLARQRWTVFDEADRLQNIVDLIAHIDRSLSEPSLYWAFRERFDLGPEFGRLQALMDNSDFLRSDLVAGSMGNEFLQAGEDRWRLLSRQLLEYNGSGLTGPIFKRNQTGALMQLSGDVEILRTSLEGFLGESFMATDEVQAFQAGENIPDFRRYRLRWDTNLLSYAAGIYEPYQRFIETGLSYFPPHLQSTLKIVAQKRLNSTLIGLIDRSQVLEPLPEGLTSSLREREIKEEIARFEEADPPINRLLTILQEAQLWETHKAFSELVAAHTYQMLRVVDSILNADNLYRPKGGDFDWWQVDRPLPYEAFGVADIEELQAYLERQRSRISMLANELAQPLVTMLSKTGGEEQRDLILKWDEILDQLSGYEDKQPGNSIEALDQLILTELPGVGLGNCFESGQAAAPVAATGDFFREQERILRDRLYRRCFAVVGEQAADAYREVQSFFTQRVAGKFPFADGISDIYPAVSDPETLREFFKVYDEKKDLIMGVPPGTPSFGTDGEAIHAFINELAGVRTFLAPFLDNKEPGALPVLDFEAEFRVNRQAEVGGDQIIEWRLEIGERELVHPPPDPVVRWTYGDRVRLLLRWADGSEWRPVKEQEAQALEIDGKTATFTYENPWALVSFLQDYPSAKSDFLTLDDEKPRTLKFLLVLERAEDEPDMRKLTEEELTSEAKVFVRVSLIAPDSKEPIRLPTFPKRAPRLPL